MDKTKLELLITARNAAKKELEAIDKQLADIEGKGKAASKGFDSKKLAEPLMQLSGGPLASIIGSFKSFLTLGGMIPKIFLGPIGAVILIVGVLEKKFGIVSKSIETVKQVFESLMTLDFAGMGEKISEIWKKPTKAGQEAIDKANEFKEKMFDIQNQILELQGNTYAAQIRAINKAYNDELAGLKKLHGEKSNEYIEGAAKAKQLMELQYAAANKKRQEDLDAEAAAQKKKVDDAAAAQKKKTDDAKAESLKRFQETVKQGQDILAQRKEDQKAADEDLKIRQEKEKADRLAMLADEEAYLQAQADAIEAYYNQIGSFISPLFDTLTDGIGGMFDRMINEGATAMDVLKDAFTSFGRMALQMIGKLIAKFLILSALKALFTGNPVGSLGAGIFNFATKGLDNLLPSRQTDYNQTRTVPGPFNQPVPIIAHGGEIIGRNNMKGGGGLTMIIQGNVFDMNQTFEQIRMGLTNHARLTGAGLSFA